LGWTEKYQNGRSLEVGERVGNSMFGRSRTQRGGSRKVRIFAAGLRAGKKGRRRQMESYVWFKPWGLVGISAELTIQRREKGAARRLRERAVDIFQLWIARFGSGVVDVGGSPGMGDSGPGLWRRASMNFSRDSKKNNGGDRGNSADRAKQKETPRKG